MGVVAVLAWRMFGTPKNYILYYVLFTAAVFVLDGVLTVLYEYAILTGLLSFNSQELAYTMLVVWVRMMEYMGIRVIAALFRRCLYHNELDEARFSGKQIAVSLALPIFSLCNMYALCFYMQFYIVPFSYILLCVNLILLVGLNIYFGVLLDVVARNQRLENERNLYRQQTLLQQEYYRQQEEKYEESRKLVHDMRNHVLAMEELYRKAEAKEALHYAEDIHRMLNDLGQKYYTSHRLLNLILNEKGSHMRHKGIREDIRIGEISLETLKDVDATTLFGNLLDNAIAAAEGTKESYIRLRVSNVHDFLLLRMENSCEQEPKCVAGEFCSQKPGGGIGLKNVRHVVEQ